MKRFGWLLMVLLVGSSLNSSVAKGQDADAAAAAARHQAEEERYRRLDSALENIQATQVSIMKRLSELNADLQQVKDEVDRLKRAPKPDFATQEDLHKLSGKVQELDQKRDHERRQMVDQLQKLGESLRLPPPREREPSAPATPATPPADMKGYEYVVQKGDSLTAIVVEYRKQGVKVTVDQVLKANPGLKAGNLFVGKKIFIPDSSLR